MSANKVLSLAQLRLRLNQHRQRLDRIVLSNGCFDLLHVGHARMLQAARQLGNVLIVAVNTDASVRRLKGIGRPIVPEDERAELVAAIACVDYVHLFDDDTPELLLHLIQPDILAKGGTTGEIVGAGIVESYGGRVVRLPAMTRISTTEILSRIV